MGIPDELCMNLRWLVETYKDLADTKDIATEIEQRELVETCKQAMRDIAVAVRRHDRRRNVGFALKLPRTIMWRGIE